jgi:GDPmannose 4,6-dehydratase
MLNRKALVTGITGQDGSYLTELLLAKGYEVHGLVRRTSAMSRSRLEDVLQQGETAVHLHYGDLGDLASLTSLMDEVQPDEIYNLAAQSQVRISFDVPEYTMDVNGLGVFRMLEATRRACPSARFYQAGTSEMFGRAKEVPQRETTPFYPRSPYGIAKVMAHHTAVHYREAYGMFVSNGILFNHESPRRGENFVTRKVAIAAARIAAGLDSEVVLGNLDAKRDWGLASEYVEAMWRMLQHNEPDDFVVATGETHTVEEFVAAAFDAVGLDWHDFVRHDERFERPTEVDILQGDASKAARVLGWEAKTRFQGLVHLLVEAELAQLDLSPLRRPLRLQVA